MFLKEFPRVLYVYKDNKSLSDIFQLQKGGYIMKKLLVAVDGSENSDRALIRAKTIAAAYDSCCVTILHVTEDLVDHGRFADHNVTENDVVVQKEIKENSLRLLDYYLEKFEGSNLQVDTLSKAGNPAKEILKVAEEDYDLIIIGSRGLGAFPGALLGSVSNKVVNKSNIDVLTVR